MKLMTVNVTEQECPYCGRAQNAENAYCIYCGSRLGARANTAADLTSKKPHASVAAEGTLHCPRCGGSNLAGNKICGWCEQPLPWAQAEPDETLEEAQPRAEAENSSAGHAVSTSDATAGAEEPLAPIAEAAGDTLPPVAAVIAPAGAAAPVTAVASSHSSNETLPPPAPKAGLSRRMIFVIYIVPAFFAVLVILASIAIMRRPIGIPQNSGNPAADDTTVPAPATAAPAVQAADQARAKAQLSQQAADEAADTARKAAQDAAAAQHALDAAKTAKSADKAAIADAEKRAAAAVADSKAAQDRADQARADADSARADNERLQQEAQAAIDKANQAQAAAPAPAPAGSPAPAGDDATPAPANGLVASLVSPSASTSLGIVKRPNDARPYTLSVPVSGSVTDKLGNHVSKSSRANLSRGGLQISNLYADLHGPGDSLVIGRTAIPVYSDSSFNSSLDASFQNSNGIAGTYTVRIFGGFADVQPLAAASFNVTGP